MKTVRDKNALFEKFLSHVELLSVMLDGCWDISEITWVEQEPFKKIIKVARRLFEVHMEDKQIIRSRGATKGIKDLVMLSAWALRYAHRLYCDYKFSQEEKAKITELFITSFKSAACLLYTFDDVNDTSNIVYEPNDFLVKLDSLIATFVEEEDDLEEDTPND